MRCLFFLLKVLFSSYLCCYPAPPHSKTHIRDKNIQKKHHMSGTFDNLHENKKLNLLTRLEDETERWKLPKSFVLNVDFSLMIVSCSGLVYLLIISL